jgi:hypothetical protein
MAVVTGSVAINLQITQQADLSLPPALPLPYTPATGAGQAQYLIPGTGPRQLNLLYAGTVPLPANTPVTLDLRALADFQGRPVVLARARLFYAFNPGRLDGPIIRLGNAGPGEWTAFIPAGGTVPLPAQGELCFSAPLATGLAVTPTSHLLKIDPGPDAHSIVLVIAGADA